MAHEIIKGRIKQVRGARRIAGSYGWNKKDEYRKKSDARLQKFLSHLQDSYGDTGNAAGVALIRLKNEFYGNHKGRG